MSALVRLVGLALMNVQFRPDVLLNKGAQVATAVRQLDGAADLRLQVMQGRRSVQGCDHLRTRSDPEAALPSKEHVLGNGCGRRARGRPHLPLKAIGARSGSVGQGMNVSQETQV